MFQKNSHGKFENSIYGHLEVPFTNSINKYSRHFWTNKYLLCTCKMKRVKHEINEKNLEV